MLKLSGQSDPDPQRYLRHRQTDRQRILAFIVRCRFLSCEFKVFYLLCETRWACSGNCPVSFELFSSIHTYNISPFQTFWQLEWSECVLRTVPGVSWMFKTHFHPIKWTKKKRSDWNETAYFQKSHKMMKFISEGQTSKRRESTTLTEKSSELWLDTDRPKYNNTVVRPTF